MKNMYSSNLDIAQCTAGSPFCNEPRKAARRLRMDCALYKRTKQIIDTRLNVESGFVLLFMISPRYLYQSSHVLPTLQLDIKWFGKTSVKILSWR